MYVCVCSAFFFLVCFRLQPSSSPPTSPDHLPCHQAPLHGSLSGSFKSVPSTHTHTASRSTVINSNCSLGNFERRHSTRLCQRLRAFFFVVVALNHNFYVNVQRAAYKFSLNRIRRVYQYSFSSELLKGMALVIWLSLSLITHYNPRWIKYSPALIEGQAL